jgi:hypothetical protein
VIEGLRISSVLHVVQTICDMVVTVIAADVVHPKDGFAWGSAAHVGRHARIALGICRVVALDRRLGRDEESTERVRTS